MGYEIDFFPVGDGGKSGDAITLRFGNLYGRRDEQTVVVVDGGFQKSGENIVEHIRQYYDTDSVNLVISTHPDADHVSGLKVVLEELTVGTLWMHQPWNHTENIANLFKDGRVTEGSVREKLQKSLEHARGLEELAFTKRIPIIEPFQGLTDTTGCLRVLGPSKTFYEDLLPHFRSTPEARETGVIEQLVKAAKEALLTVAESLHIETLNDEGETAPENNSSTILLLTVDGRSSLLTADAGTPALAAAADILESEDFDRSMLKFIQVPHHGSKRNVGPTILNRLIGEKQQSETKLMSAFVSASKDAAPKHPAKKVTNAFRRRGAPVCVTNGQTIRHHHEAPDRGWTALLPLPLYNEVEE